MNVPRIWLHRTAWQTHVAGNDQTLEAAIPAAAINTRVPAASHWRTYAAVSSGVVGRLSRPRFGRSLACASLAEISGAARV